MKLVPFIFSLIALALSASAAEKISYAREILPILSDKCFFCHGPDKDKQEADLRLYIRADAIKASAWDPANQADSEALIRIFSTDRKEVMPPPKYHLTLTDREKPCQNLDRARGGIRKPLGFRRAAEGNPGSGNLRQIVGD